MHPANDLYWQTCAKKYPKYFNDPSRVIEFGSYNINGSIRSVFKCKDYTGIDWRPGPDVDVVSLAHAYKTDKPYNTVTSASMLEHDPHWEKSLNALLDCVLDDGILVLTWGAALNPGHCFKEAPDGKFHALPAGKVINKLKAEGMYIHEFQYESLFVKRTDPSSAIIPRPRMRGTLGEVGLVAFWDKKHAKGERIIDEMVPEDAVQ
jgi:hypothetical protein